jgi:hypothetical protein
MKTPLIALFAAAALSMPALAEDRSANPPRYSQGQTRSHNEMQPSRKRAHSSTRRLARRGRPAIFPRRAKVGPEPLQYPR